MPSLATTRSRLPILALLLAVAAVAGPARSQDVPEAAHGALSWRLVGPFRAGWATVVSGVPGDPATFYAGTADGGLWRTTDAGVTWRPLLDEVPASAVGALALAPSDPQVIYVGTGQVAARYDVMAGSGVYRSGDGGATWVSAGLADSRHIGRILVDPRDPDTLLVAALGHLFGPNPERGVFRSTDGGRTWQAVLRRDEDTGAVDLAADPGAPDVVYAALWQARNRPWLDYFMPLSGPGSGIYRSTDAGRTFAPVGGEGLPAGPLGRIGLAVGAGTGGRRVYAVVEAPAAGGVYRSDDGGATWRLVNDTAGLGDSYFGRLTAHPTDPDVVWAADVSLQRSDDGGATFTRVKGAPGGDDYHSLWIDPLAPRRMITGSDQGATITLNGGETWSSWYNQPTGQFYHVATDDRFPYWIYSGQQDSGTVGIASRSDYGQLTFRDWHPVGGDERDYDLPDPTDPDVVYASGLGGRLSRFDRRTGQVGNISPWPVGSYAARPTTVEHRYPWVSPLAVSPLPPHALYFSAQTLFRSLDGGRTWETISPDLTGAQPGAAGCDGDVPVERATACGYGVISTIAPSPVEVGVIWVGTDNGRVQLTRDGGATWTEVTPPAVSDWSRIAQIEASPGDAATAYVAVDRHRRDDFAPYAYRAHDFGRTWTAIAGGLPAGAYVNVVRQDPVAPRLLYAGTRRGAYVSFDDGESWQPLRRGLPPTAVNDLTLRRQDLVAATQGRALWVLDDVTPLRQLAAGAPTAEPWLFAPADAHRLRFNQNRDTPLPPEEPTAPNPPAGAVLDYWLPAAATSPVVLEVLDAQGRTLRRFAGDEAPADLPAERYFTASWVVPAAPPSAAAGHHRFVWDLRLPRPPALRYQYSIAAVPGRDTPLLPQGALVLPGDYQVRLTVDGRILTQPLRVLPDPRVTVAPGELEDLLAVQQEVAAALGEAVRLHGEAAALAERLAGIAGRPAPSGRRRSAHDAAVRLAAEVEKVLVGTRGFGLRSIAGTLTALATDLESADRAPTAAQRAVLAEYRSRLAAVDGRWRELAATDLPRLERELRRAGLTAGAGGA